MSPKSETDIKVLIGHFHESPCASGQNESQGGVKPFIYENEFDLHKNEPSLGA